MPIGRTARSREYTVFLFSICLGLGSKPRLINISGPTLILVCVLSTVNLEWPAVQVSFLFPSHCLERLEGENGAAVRSNVCSYAGASPAGTACKESLNNKPDRAGGNEAEATGLVQCRSVLAL